jgi:SAM-dependent MidA family methyltransferase
MTAGATLKSALRRAIEDEIRAHGPIPFSRYMELCLYHPELGYYSREREQFGKTGDFYTSSDVHAVFGRLLCRQFEQMWRVLGSPEHIDIVELGPGRGLFANDVLSWAQKTFPEFHQAVRYTLVESSPGLRRRLEELFREPMAGGKVQVQAELAGGRCLPNAIVFANEFFDALPVEVLTPRGRLLVGLAEQQATFSEVFAPAPADVLEFVDRYGVHPGEHERVEAAPAYRDWIGRIAGSMERGFVVLIDYGYTRAELLAGRHRGTVTSFRRHAVCDSPYEAPGEQDITAHVNFTALAEIGREAGLATQPPVTQSQFLLGIGEQNQFADAFAGCRLPQEQAKVALQLKHLVTPAGMGESFQVLVLSRGVETRAVGSLSGLSFAR